MHICLPGCIRRVLTTFNAVTKVKLGDNIRIARLFWLPDATCSLVPNNLWKALKRLLRQCVFSSPVMYTYNGHSLSF